MISINIRCYIFNLYDSSYKQLKGNCNFAILYNIVSYYLLLPIHDI